MNALDVIALLLIIITFVAGIRSGFFPQLGGLLGAAAGGIVALQLLPFVRPQLDGLDPSMRALVVLVGLVILIAVGETIGSAGGYRIRSRLGKGVLAGMDSAGGGSLGLGQGLLVIWLVGGLLAAGPLPNLAAQAQRSAAIRALSGILPSPTTIAGELGRWLDASGSAGSLRGPGADPRAARQPADGPDRARHRPEGHPEHRRGGQPRPAPTRSRAAGSSSRTATS